jgi:hypothetical protein
MNSNDPRLRLAIELDLLLDRAIRSKDVGACRAGSLELSGHLRDVVEKAVTCLQYSAIISDRKRDGGG